MDCNCQSSKPGPLIITIGDSASEYWNLTSGCPPQTVGDNTWGAEFGIVDARHPDQVLFKTYTNDGTNQIFWSQPGQVTLFLKQATTAGWKPYMLPPRIVNWYLAVVAPTQLDPAGFRMTIGQGRVLLRQEGQIPCDELMYGKPVPCPEGANINRGGFGGACNYDWGFPFYPNWSGIR